MVFECPNCGRCTSSSLSLDTGGYWTKYSRGGPWGCVSCKTRLDIRCQSCGAVGTTQTIPNGYCKSCQVVECANCRCEVERQYLIGTLCPPCSRLDVQCECPNCGEHLTFPRDSQSLGAECAKCNLALIVPTFQEKLRFGCSVFVTGDYRCGRCGPEGEAADFVRASEDPEFQTRAAKESSFLATLLTAKAAIYLPEARKEAQLPSVVKRFTKGEVLPLCPNGCGENTHWIIQNLGSLRASLVDNTADVREYVVIAADRVTAIEQAIALGASREGLLAVIQNRKEKAGVVEEKAPSKEDAVAAARGQLPADAGSTGDPIVRQEAGSGKNSVEAMDEFQARAKWRQEQPSGAQTDNFSCDRMPRRGFLGIFRRSGIWVVTWSRECVVRIGYRIPAQFTVRAIHGRL